MAAPRFQPISARSSRSASSHGLRNTLAAIGVAAVALHGSRLYLKLFGSNLPYGMPEYPRDSLDSDAFARFLSATTDGAPHGGTRLDVLRDGECFYRAELDAIRNAKHNINLLFYEFLKGKVADEFLRALIERARAGLKVRLIVDAIGSMGTTTAYFDELKAAGGQMEWFKPLRWNTWTHMDSRTHRKLLIVDGQTGFIGGAGIADCWRYGGRRSPAWRDTMIRVEGSAVTGLLSAFSENWVECSGEILSGRDQFPSAGDSGLACCMVVNSTPHGGSTKARILFQTLIDCARETIRITTPYFLPDRSARRALIRARKERNVRIQIVTAGRESDHPGLARVSEAICLDLTRAGVEIYEYMPGMIHAKIMTIDGIWSVAGSTNFDHRSFALNDEVNVAAMDRALAGQLDRDFAEDMARSKRRTLRNTTDRSVSVRLLDKLEKLVQRES